jgi:asparagine synthase (glutamine-hydrolysing)
MEIRQGRIVGENAWFQAPMPDRADPRDEGQRVSQLRELLEQVVEEHLVADVPVAMLLSGGLDSSLIAALAARKSRLHTLTMAFEGAEFDERQNAHEVSRFIGSEHADILIRPADVKAEIASGAWVFDDLFADWATVTTRLLYRRCRERGFKVVLVGEGADELFGGYDIFRLPPRLGLWQQFRLYQKYAGRRWGRQFGAFRAALAPYLESAGDDAFDAVRLFESRRQLPNQYVMKVDKASMAESVEARAPYLDRRVAEYAYRTGSEWLLRGGENKYLLRALARREAYLPAQAAARPKFGAPLAANWMDDDPQIREFAHAQLLAPDSRTRELGLAHAMRAYYEQGRGGYPFPAALSIFRNLAWRLLLLELWCQHYLRRRPL